MAKNPISFPRVALRSTASQEEKTSSSFIAEALQRTHRSMVYVLILGLCVNVLLLAPSIYSLQVLDRVLSSASVPTLIYLSLIMLVAIAFYGIFGLIRSSILMRIGEWLETKVSKRLLAMSTTQNAAGDATQSSRYLRDVQTIKGFIAGNALISLFDTPWSLLFLLVIFLMHPVLGVITLLGSLVLLGLAVMNELIIRKPHAIAERIQYKAHTFADSISRNAEAVEAMGMMEDMAARWSHENSRAQEMLLRSGGRGLVAQQISRSFRIMIQIAITGVGGYLAIQHEITAGALIASSILAGRALAPFDTAIGSWKHLLAARESYGRLNDAIQYFAHERGETVLPPPEGQLKLENVFYAPPQQKPIIKGISLELNAGETLGIIGPSAAGKSTLAKLMVGILPTSNGAVRLDSAEIFKWNREFLGPYIGYMPQRVDLFQGSVLENIARMQPEPDHAKVIEAAQFAGVHEMILHLPEGYDTIVQPGNNTLSPGQQQRIGLARAVYGEPRLVVLDEPNASMDIEGEQALLRTLANLRHNGVTCIVVAHKPTLVQNSDKILLLKQGVVQDFGPTKTVLGKYLVPHAVPARGGH